MARAVATGKAWTPAVERPPAAGGQGVRVPYSSLHRFAIKHCGFSDRRRVTVRVAGCEPGELAEMDFGRLGLAWDPERGRRRTAWALVAVLVYSRHQYLHVTFSQKAERTLGMFGADVGWMVALMMVIQTALFIACVWAGWNFFGASEPVAQLQWACPRPCCC